MDKNKNPNLLYSKGVKVKSTEINKRALLFSAVQNQKKSLDLSFEKIKLMQFAMETMLDEEKKIGQEVAIRLDSLLIAHCQKGNEVLNLGFRVEEEISAGMDIKKEIENKCSSMFNKKYDLLSHEEKMKVLEILSHQSKEALRYLRAAYPSI